MKEQLAKEIISNLSGGDNLNKNAESYSHFSPSSLNIPIQKYIISYVASTQAMRRENKVNYKAVFGNLCANTIQRIVSKYIYENEIKKEVKPEAFEKIFADEVEKLNKYNEPKDARDEYCRVEMIPFCKASAQQILKLVKSIFGERELTSEETVSHTPEGLILKIKGKIDFSSDDMFLELKSKPVNFRKNKNGFGTIVQKLPDSYEQIPDSYMRQVAFYWVSNSRKKKPYLGYVNSETYKIFEPENDRLEYHYQQLCNKAFTIQNLFEISKGDPMKMAQYVEAPDLSNFYYSDLTEEQQEITNRLWNL